jgi:predicted homoserine dehydrogenase-like protein
MTLFNYVTSWACTRSRPETSRAWWITIRTPETQQGFAEQNDQDVRKVTSFADSTKLSMETTVLANATGFRAGRRGMHGPKCGYVRELAQLLPAEEMLDGGIVDYCVGASPHTGAFVNHSRRQPVQAAATRLLQARARAVLRLLYAIPPASPPVAFDDRPGRDPLGSNGPRWGPMCQVVTIAKRDLKAGERLDGVGVTARMG